MKKSLFILGAIVLLYSCASFFPGKSYKRANPKIKKKNYHTEYYYDDNYYKDEFTSIY